MSVGPRESESSESTASSSDTELRSFPSEGVTARFNDDPADLDVVPVPAVLVVGAVVGPPAFDPVAGGELRIFRRTV